MNKIKLKPIIQKLKYFFDTVTLSGLDDRENLEISRRIRLLHLLTLTGTSMLLIMAVIVYIEGITYLAIIDSTTAIVLFGMRIYLKKTGDYKNIGLAGVMLILIFFLFFYVTGGNNNTGYLWSFTLPLLASFLLGSKQGLFISILYIFLILLSHFLPITLKTLYPMEFKIRFILALFTVTMFSYYMELLRENTNARLISKNNNLDRLIIGLKKTELQLMESKELAEESNKSKSEFLRNMSHELRTPLNHIIGFSQLIKDGIPGPVNEEQEEYLGDILESSSHLLSLINDLLDLARIESGKETINLESVNIKAIIEEAIDMFQNKKDNNGLKIILNTESLPSEILIDKRKIIQILYNLISNAVKFTKIGGFITVSARADKTNIIISIIDTGIGLEAKSRDLIFESFGQVENNLTRKFEGTGLGLAITKNMVELLGGKIWVESEGLGNGSTFSFTLPLAQP